MTKQVRCISPHGGCHNGMWHDGTPVFAMLDGTIPQPPPEKLRLPANPGGYVADSRLGFCAVGQVYDVPGEFYADGFHWEEIGGGATVLKPPEDAPSKAPPPPPAPPKPTIVIPAPAGEGK